MSQTRLALTGQDTDVSSVVLKIDGLDLLFRQSDIRALESASDVDGSNPRTGSTGWISYLRQRWPVYCLSDRLDLLNVVPPARRTCALLAIDTGYAGILCNDVSIFKLTSGKRHEVPVAMRHADTPILELFPSGDRLLCVSNPDLLSAHIENLVHKITLPAELPCPA